VREISGTKGEVYLPEPGGYSGSGRELLWLLPVQYMYIYIAVANGEEREKKHSVWY
jgi:hypothetical protein